MPTPAEPSGPRPPSGRGRPRVVAGQTLEVLAKLAHARPARPSSPETATDLGRVVVRGVTLDSRAVRDGDLYAALPGSRAHGATFVEQAAHLGAVAVLTDATGAGIAADQGCPVPVLAVDDVRAALGEVSAAVYDHPADRLVLLGVTGTNGKTTTTYLVDGALRAQGLSTGLLGTVETRVAERSWPSVRTTPEAPDVQALLARMVEEGVRACSMEVSSHALSLHRVDGMVFDVVGFTNLSRDHLDFHPTMEDYFAAKAALFTPRHARAGVVCVDDAWGARLADGATIPVVTLAGEGSAVPADWQVVDVAADPAGTAFALVHRDGERVPLRAPLPGAFNVSNTALAFLMLRQVRAGLAPAADGQDDDPGLDDAALAAAIAVAGQVPGRMELVRAVGDPGPGEPVVLVDYAHTPSAVESALATLGSSPRPLVVVLGAGGDRDTHKRDLMGDAAARLADVVIVTDDNPRSEPPELIRGAVLAGARRAAAGRDPAPVVLELDRRRTAITEAVHRAWGHGVPGGTVLLAGKGHEQGQEVAGVVHPFDDRVVAGEVVLAARRTVAHAERRRRTDEETST